MPAHKKKHAHSKALVLAKPRAPVLYQRVRNANPSAAAGTRTGHALAGAARSTATHVRDTAHQAHESLPRRLEDLVILGAGALGAAYLGTYLRRKYSLDPTLLAIAMMAVGAAGTLTTNESGAARLASYGAAAAGMSQILIIQAQEAGAQTFHSALDAAAQKKAAEVVAAATTSAKPLDGRHAALPDSFDRSLAYHSSRFDDEARFTDANAGDFYPNYAA